MEKDGRTSRVGYTMSVEIPTQFTHSIKLEETAKGVRITVHIYANDRVKAMDEAIGTYEVMKGKLEEEEIPIAPMEVSK